MCVCVRVCMYVCVRACVCTRACEVLLSVFASMQAYEGRASELTDCVYHSGAPIFHDG